MKHEDDLSCNKAVPISTISSTASKNYLKTTFHTNVLFSHTLYTIMSLQAFNMYFPIISLERDIHLNISASKGKVLR